MVRVTLDLGPGSMPAASAVKILRTMSTQAPLTTEERSFVDWLRTEIEEQMPKPRIPEPGPWRVVEAACVHSDRRREWVHHPTGLWWPITTRPEGLGSDLLPPEPDDWDSLVDPVLLPRTGE